MQTLFDAHYPSLDIHILGVNEVGFDSQNDLMSAQGDLPWLQDVDSDRNGTSDVWDDSWAVTYRDVQIVDRNGDLADIFNVTSNNLLVIDTFNVLRDKFIAVAATPALSDWQSPIEPMDVNEDGQIAPIDALLTINAINSGESGVLTTSSTDLLIDVTGDGQLSPLDPLFVINHLNRNRVTSAPRVALSAVVEAEAPAADVVFAS